MNIYKKLIEGGGYSLPFLVHLSSASGKNIYLVNNIDDIDYDGHRYKAASFSYTPSDTGDSSFSVEIAEHDEIIDILEDERAFNVEVTGIFNGEEVEEISAYRHSSGEGTWDGAKLEMKLNKDERGTMTFPALIFNSYNNRGNA
ncbi:MAG: hypothetical protein IJ717_00875 [Treponema sp.]|nr:hypothetical protein [Treponema sp.]